MNQELNQLIKIYLFIYNSTHITYYTLHISKLQCQLPLPPSSNMSEVLRAPWILQSALDDLSNDATSQSGLNHLHRTPKLVQIIQVSRRRALYIKYHHFTFTFIYIYA